MSTTLQNAVLDVWTASRLRMSGCDGARITVDWDAPEVRIDSWRGTTRMPIDRDSLSVVDARGAAFYLDLLVESGVRGHAQQYAHFPLTEAADELAYFA